ncbi:MAG: hypothetical protein HON90_01085, partial [Halobacteriovoraceae bacterium]|nr:hypothetical protein [Halobacteriovoraceae bacterium]
ITLLAAGMSTLDGILVALSSMVVNDIYIPYKGKDNIDSAKALKLSRLFLILIGLISLVIAWNPPQLVGLFAQKGVYALAAASVIPIVVGVFSQEKVNPNYIFIASGIGFFGHLILNTFGGVANPAVSSMYSIFMSALFIITILFINKQINLAIFTGNSKRGTK